jgi:hypothetical protein
MLRCGYACRILPRAVRFSGRVHDHSLKANLSGLAFSFVQMANGCGLAGHSAEASTLPSGHPNTPVRILFALKSVALPRIFLYVLDLERWRCSRFDTTCY